MIVKVSSSVVPGSAHDLVAVPVVARYFETFNQGDFQTAAALFSAQGKLLPPFESELVGPEAIAAYLTREAGGMKAVPRQFKPLNQDAVLLQVDVVGKVQTAAFQINARWRFQIDAQAEILMLEIKLMATLKELLSLTS